jgi:hypothetical protein
VDGRHVKGLYPEALGSLLDCAKMCAWEAHCLSTRRTARNACSIFLVSGKMSRKSECSEGQAISCVWEPHPANVIGQARA